MAGSLYYVAMNAVLVCVSTLPIIYIKGADAYLYIRSKCFLENFRYFCDFPLWFYAQLCIIIYPLAIIALLLMFAPDRH